MLDPLALMFLLVVSVIGPLDAFLALRDLQAKLRARRLHRRNRRWVRRQPACPACPDRAGQAGASPDRGRRDDGRSLVTLAAPISTRRRVQL